MPHYKRINLQGFENCYAISKTGKLYNIRLKKIVYPHIVNGYYRIHLKNDQNDFCNMAIHRLVAYTYIPNPNNVSDVNHKDGNTLNNHVDNLEWCTRKQNNQHAQKMGLVNSNSHKKKVIQYSYDENGKEVIIAIYDSVNDAATAMKVSRHAIIRTCKGKNHSCREYKFKYEFDDRVVKDPVEHRKIYEFPNIPYEVSITGRIYSTRVKKYLEPVINRNGNDYVTLPAPNGSKVNRYISRLVWEAFNNKSCGDKNVIHIDKNKLNNHINNLKCS